MADASVKNFNALKQAKADMATKCYPAFDDLLLLALERRHLELPAFTSVLEDESNSYLSKNLSEHLKQNVRFMKLSEISFDSNESIHLAGVENAITSMRGMGMSLLFVVQGNMDGASIYLGISRFSNDDADISSVIKSYSAAWQANFPGSNLTNISTENVKKYIANEIEACSELGVITGIPSLKREEETNLFVQGLERLIRAMRGKQYTWISIADPIPQHTVRDAISACQKLQSDVHQFVTTDVSKATSNGKTVMLGMFGMLGQGKTEGTAKTDSTVDTQGTNSSTATTDGTNSSTSTTEGTSKSTSTTEGTNSSSSHTDSRNRSSSHSGSCIVYTYNRTNGESHSDTITQGVSHSTSIMNATSKSKTLMEGISHSQTLTQGVMSSLAKGWANTISQAVSTQMGGGMFSSFGMTWTNTTTVGQEFLNRKMQFIEETLQAYEKRLQEGTALGMWNLGHYFCAADQDTYDLGSGVITSLFSGMESIYEPPRTIRLPEGLKNTLRFFNNIYLRFSPFPIDVEKIKADSQDFTDHPLGFVFNGPATPVNTRELAIATPITTQDVEGVTVSQRSAFGINIPEKDEKENLSLGIILDKGNETKLRYKMTLSNLPKHLAVFGLTGSGKTNTVHHLLIQLWENYKIPFMVIEPAKAEYRALAKHESLRKDLLIISAGIEHTSACPLRLNPFDFLPGTDSDANRIHVLTHIDRLKATFNASFPMYASMPYILEEAILEVYRERGWDLGRSSNMHTDIYSSDFSDYIPTLQDLYLKIDSIVKRKGYFQEQQMNIQAALKARLSSLMVGAKGNMFNCKHSISPKDFFERPVVIELDNMGDDDEKAFLMGLFVSKLYEYRKATNTTNEGDNVSLPKHVLVIEEAHRLLANIPDTSSDMESSNVKGKAVSAFVDMLSEIRALRESVFVVDQLPSRVSPNIIKGTGTKIVHRMLAKDDRESVGWTMGLNDNQIEDLSLLRTGECVVSQDGDRKAFMCKVRKNDIHENKNGNELSDFTINFKEYHSQLFEIPDNIDLEDVRFRDDLYAMMLAIGVGQDFTDIKKILPTRYRNCKYSDLHSWHSVYWQQISREVWNYYGGDYKLFVSFNNAGLSFVTSPEDKNNQTQYRNAFVEYFKNTKQYLYAMNENLVGAAYRHLFDRTKVFETLNQSYDRLKTTSLLQERLGIMISKVIPFVSPHGIKINETIQDALIEEILFRIAPEFSLKDVANYINGGK